MDMLKVLYIGRAGVLSRADGNPSRGWRSAVEIVYNG